MAAVFDADTDLARDVNTRLNREAHAFFDDHVVALHDGWKFVNIHTDTMAEAVIEILTVASFFDDLPSGAIYFMSCDTWLDKVKCSLLGFQCQMVDIFFELVRLTNSNSPRHIASIAINHAAKVKEQESVIFDFIGTGNAVRISCIISRQHHSFKAHLIAFSLDGKVNLSDDICFSIVQ